MVGAVCFDHYVENVAMLSPDSIRRKSSQLSKVVVATWVLSHSDTETTPETH